MNQSPSLPKNETNLGATMPTPLDVQLMGEQIEKAHSSMNNFHRDSMAKPNRGKASSVHSRTDPPKNNGLKKPGRLPSLGRHSYGSSPGMLKAENTTKLRSIIGLCDGDETTVSSSV